MPSQRSVSKGKCLSALAQVFAFAAKRDVAWLKKIFEPG
jgi:hypothetical protein